MSVVRRVCCLLLAAAPVAAQTPFPLYDPFYFDEAARLGYDDAYAVSGDVAFRPAVSDADPSALVPDPLAVAARLDLRLGRSLDVGAVLDASSEGLGRSLRWSWATARYAWTTDAGGQQAFRLAVDPNTDGSVGFPLVDLAFLSSGPATGDVATDFGIGMRRVQRGFQRFVPVTVQDGASSDFDVRFERAFGWELRAVVGAARVFDVAGSRVYASVTGLRGVYEVQAFGSDDAPDAPPRDVASTAVWLQAGVAFDRPSLRLAPYVRLPVYASKSPETVATTVALGLRVTVR